MTIKNTKLKSIIAILAVILCAALAISVASCGKKGESPSVSESSDRSETTSEISSETTSEKESEYESESESGSESGSTDTSTETYRIRWVEDEDAEFIFDGATPRTAKAGDTIAFGLRVSPYYEGNPVVKAGSAIVEMRADGKYVFTVTGSVTVSVEGLKRANAVISGLGTQKNPYKISNASQLKTFSDSINAGLKKYKEAYIDLMADISLNGETISPIGTDASSYFMGKFNGNGHTISNFNVDATQGLIGFFGYVVTAEIKNLDIRTDFTIQPSSELASSLANLIIGGVAAYNIGSDIINCSYSGNFSLVSNLSGVNVFFGGICGFMQGYSDEYTASISYSRVSGSIKSIGNNSVYAAGGLAGTIYGTSSAAPASIYNSTFSGEISGNIENAGGIVGYLREQSSVANCLVTGRVNAEIKGVSTNAGTIAGKTDNETAITRVVSGASVKCSFSSDDGVQDVFGGLLYNDGYLGIDDRKGVIKDAYQTKNATDVNAVCELVGWNKADWTVKGGEIIPLYDENAKRNIHAHFIFGTEVTKVGQDGNPLTLTEDTLTTEAVIPVYWCYDGGSGMNNFTADDGRISYGYFFDASFTERVPSSYLLTNDVDIYVGFADYSDIAGDYYLTLQENKDNSIKNVEVHLVFDDNGKMTMSFDGIVAYYMYVFTGETIMIKDGYFAYIQYPTLAKKYELTVDYYCDVVEGGNSLKIYDNVFFTKESNREISANKLNKAMGVWYDADGSVYTFHSDGSGTIEYASGSSGQEMFSYTCSGDSVTIKLGTKTGYAVISADGNSLECTTLGFTVTKADIFKGLWESNFANKKVIDFDGKGTVIYNGESFEYVIDGSEASFGDGITAKFNSDGLLVVTDNNKETVYGKEGSYIGVWRETLLDYTMILNGIGKDGYGTGKDSNNINFTYVATKDGNDIIVNMYYRTTLYGMFNEIASKYDDSVLLAMAGYYFQSGMIVDDFNMCYYDPLKGAWNATDGATYEFNGFGEYNINYNTSDGKLWQAQGFVDVTKDGKTEKVRYKYNRATATAEFTYGGVKYSVSLGDDGIVINKVICKAPDEVSTYKYHVGDDILEFNGKSSVGLGKVKVTSEGVETEYDYTLETSANTMTATVISGGKELYKLVFVSGKGTVYKNGANVTDKSGLYHKIIGKTYLISGEMTFYANGLLNMEGHVKGMFADFEADIYYVDENNISVGYDGNLLYYVSYVNENTLALLDSSNQVKGVLTVPDGLQGKYEAADGSTLELDGRSKSGYVNAVMTLTVIEDYDGEKESVEYTYVYKDENGELFVYELDRSGEEDVLIKKYKISETKTDGAKEFKNDDRTLYLSEITE